MSAVGRRARDSCNSAVATESAPAALEKTYSRRIDAEISDESAQNSATNRYRFLYWSNRKARKKFGECPALHPVRSRECTALHSVTISAAQNVTDFSECQAGKHGTGTLFSVTGQWTPCGTSSVKQPARHSSNRFDAEISDEHFLPRVSQ